MDKPGSPDLQLYKKLLAGCKAKSLPFQIGYMFRVNPAFEFARKTIQNKLIGDLTFMELDMNHCYGGEPYQEYMRRLPGGIMYNLGCHLIDFTVRTLGAPQKVTPYLRSVKGDAPDTQNLCMAVLEYENALVNIRACSKAPICDYANGRTMTIEGTNGSIFCKPLEIIGGPKEQELELYIHKECGDFPAGRHFMRFAPPRDRHEKQLEEFAATIRGEAKETLTREHDLLTHEVILAASGFENIVIGKETL
jgi:predicted dehydrogenase